MNYIADISYKVENSAIDGVTDLSNLFNAVIEISNGDNVKYELHSSGKYLTAVRVLNPIFRYPFSYGFIPQTLEEDGDGLDVIVITPEPLAHLSVIEVRVLGFIPTIDNGVSDTKIIAVPAYSSLKRVSTEKVMAFLKNYKYPNNENTSVKDFNPDSAQAINIIERAHRRWIESCLDSSRGKYITVRPPLNPTVALLADKTPEVITNTNIEKASDTVQSTPEIKPDTESKTNVGVLEEVKTDTPVPFLETIVSKEKEKIEPTENEWLS